MSTDDKNLPFPVVENLRGQSGSKTIWKLYKGVGFFIYRDYKGLMEQGLHIDPVNVIGPKF